MGLEWETFQELLVLIDRVTKAHFHFNLCKTSSLVKTLVSLGAEKTYDKGPLQWHCRELVLFSKAMVLMTIYHLLATAFMCEGTEVTFNYFGTSLLLDSKISGLVVPTSHQKFA